MRGAFLEVFSDMLGSAGVIAAGVVLITTGWPYADPIIGAAIGLFILPRAWRLGRDALRVLLEIAPHGIDIAAIEGRLCALPGVAAVHDIHAWTLTSGMPMATGHIVVEHDADRDAVLQRAITLLRGEFDLTHVTLQCESPGEDGIINCTRCATDATPAGPI